MFRWWDRIQQWRRQLPSPWPHVLTWIAHTLITLGAGLVGYVVHPVLGTLFAVLAAVAYTIREITELVQGGEHGPWWDHVGDLVGPWLVAVTMAALL